ncbi:DNA polymerase III subunit delta [Planctomycetes bacterium Poly30]|uniref:DNA polymerase III subunit delta n=1 Tax=Saltatorellus ferox TaxID=2528018 RepID=A0A518ES65_9BACT|nr:DNA polymerase III subunit delta [Planctomycetes bacterium Poly30]
MAKKAASRGAAKRKDPQPEDGLRMLARQLSEGLPPIIILRGEESYFRERGVALAVAAAKAAGMEICRHDALDPEYSAATLLDDLATGALFQSARCIVLRGAERVIIERALQFSSAIRDAMRARLERKAEGLLVLSAARLLATNVLSVAADEAGGANVGCRRLYDKPPQWDPDPRKAELVQWCAGRARDLKVEVNLNEAAYIVAATGNDLAAIDDQLKRLVGRGKEGIQELVAWDASASPFEVADQIAAGDVKRALVGLETLFSGGASQRDGSRTVDVAGIVAQLSASVSGKIREACRVAEAVVAGMAPQKAAERCGVKGGRSGMESFLQSFQARSPEEWAQMLDEFGELERRSRSNVAVDVTDFAQFALRWRRRQSARR